MDLPDGGTAPEMAITLPDSDPLGALYAPADLFPAFKTDLFRGGGRGGGGYAPSGGGGATFSGFSDSLAAADDLSDVFGSKWTAGEDERFEVAGDALDRRFSVELERLRAAATDVEAPRADGGAFVDDGGAYMDGEGGTMGR